MGVFDRLKRPAEEPWVPPLPGSCSCDEHVEQVRDHQIPRVSDSGDVTVGALLESGSIAVDQAGPEPTYISLPVTGQRVGPFHWKVRVDGEARDLFALDAAAALDDCLSLQDGVERVAWPEHDSLLVGAPGLCPSGVLAAVVRALDNPRVRLRDA